MSNNLREIKALIATQSYFKGAFSNDYFYIQKAPKQFYRPMDGLSGFSGYLKDWHYYTLSISVPEKTREQIVIPNLSFEVDFTIILLSILYGKIFENYGYLMGTTDFLQPNLACRNFSKIASLPFNSNVPRKNTPLDLDLSYSSKILPLLSPNFQNKKLIQYIYSAGRFYLHAIQEAQYNPEIAFLDLISCGEIISDFYEYTEDELYDDELIRDFEEISSLVNGETINKKIKSRLFQIKRKFTLTIDKLLTEDFFEVSEAKDNHFALKKSDIRNRIKMAYDLRSHFVHVGIEFGHWVSAGMKSNNEILGAKPISLVKKDYLRLFEFSPSIIGLERIMRYCLLRFIHLNGCKIDDSLDRKGLI